jgi:hypothetical protein
MLQPPTGTVTVRVGLSVWATVKLNRPVRLSPAGFFLQTSSQPLGFALLVKVRMVWFSTPPAAMVTLAVPPGRSDCTSRVVGMAAIAATLKPGRATSVTLAWPTGRVTGRLQPSTGTSTVPDRPSILKAKLPATPLPEASLQISSVPVCGSAAA